MSILNGGEVGRRASMKSGFQGAAAGASNVKAKAQVGSGLINLNKLKSLQSRKKSNLETYKLNANGLSRIRLVKPLGNDDVPMVSADAHWVPVVNEDGKQSKRKIYCYYQFGFDFCPICALREALMTTNDQALIADSDQLKATNKWASYIINRDYMAGAEDPIAAHDPRQDKIVLFDNMNPKIADDIIKHLGMRVWGDASDPTGGYDFEIEGVPSGKVFNTYKVSDYALSPIPKDFSPPYDEALLKNMKPLSEIIKYMSRSDLQKIFDPILVSIQQESEEAATLISDFSDAYNDMLRAIEAGPNSGENYSDDESGDYEDDEHEVVEVNTKGGENHASRKDSTLKRYAESDSEASDHEIGSDDDESGESNAETTEYREESEESVDDYEISDEGEADDAADDIKPIMPAKPANSSPEAKRNASLLGELRNIGKKK